MEEINEYLRRTRRTDDSNIRPAMKCADGFTISVQASEYHYCSPRSRDADHYDTVELAFPNRAESLIADFIRDPDRQDIPVYYYVPIEVVNELIKKHGGIKKEP